MARGVVHRGRVVSTATFDRLVIASWLENVPASVLS